MKLVVLVALVSLVAGQDLSSFDPNGDGIIDMVIVLQMPKNVLDLCLL